MYLDEQLQKTKKKDRKEKKAASIAVAPADGEKGPTRRHELDGDMKEVESMLSVLKQQISPLMMGNPDTVVSLVLDGEQGTKVVTVQRKKLDTRRAIPSQKCHLPRCLAQALLRTRW